MDAISVFIQLCDELISRIEEASGDEWWKDIRTLTEQLEAARRKLDRPVWRYANEPEWPAFLIIEAYSPGDYFGMGAEFHKVLDGYFKMQADGGNEIEGAGMLLSCDPLAESYSESVLWYTEKKSKYRQVLSTDREEAIRKPARWKRAVQSGLLARVTAGNSDQVGAKVMEKDVFLCHASEDKKAVVRPLAAALERAGITYWLDEVEVKWGDSLTKHVNDGLRTSKFAVVVLSKTFLDKHWPQRELHAVLNIEASSGETKVLPLLVGEADDRREFMEALPLLNDKLYATWTGDADDIVTKLRARLGLGTSKLKTPNLDPSVPATYVPKLKTQVTDRDRARFLREAFGEIRAYFKQALRELEKQHTSIETDFSDVDKQKFTATIYVNGENKTQCKVWIGGLGGNDSIAYVEGRNEMHGDNTFNETLRVVTSNDRIGLTSTMAMMPFEKVEMGTPHLAAEALWKRFCYRLEQ